MSIALSCGSRPMRRSRETEVLAVDVLHRQKGMSLDLADVVDAADVRVGDLARDANLGAESRELAVAGGDRVGQELQRDRLAEDEVIRAVDLAHPATAEQDWRCDSDRPGARRAESGRRTSRWRSTGSWRRRLSAPPAPSSGRWDRGPPRRRRSRTPHPPLRRARRPDRSPADISRSKGSPYPSGQDRGWKRLERWCERLSPTVESRRQSERQTLLRLAKEHPVILPTLAVLLFTAVASNEAQGNTSANPVVGAARGEYERVREYLLESAEQMPESDYAFKPTAAVRSFGEIVAHVASTQFMFCAAAQSTEESSNHGHREGATDQECAGRRAASIFLVL